MAGSIVNPQQNTEEIAGIVDSAKQTVEDRFTQALAYGDSAFSACQSFLGALAQASGELGFSPVHAPLLTINPIAYGFRPGDTPQAPDITLDLPAFPEAPVLESIAISPQAVPQFNESAPTVTFPDPPSADLPSPPSDIPQASVIDMPIRPVVTLPDLPTFLPVTLPDVPIANLPTFAAVEPSANLIVPNNIMGIVADSYTSAILTALQNKLLNDILNGGTGLGAAIENALWQREEERARIALQEARDKIAAEWSKRGFDLPDGVLAAQLTQVDTEYMNRRLDTSRDIAIKQAELAFQNTQFIIQQGITLENTLINFANAVAQRSFEGMKALQDASIAIFNASLAKYQADLEAYKTKAAVYESLIRGELAKAEFYKAQVAAAQTTVEVNKAYADLYRLQIAGVEELIKMYATEMEASKIRADIDKNRIEVFRAQVEGYVARVNAKTAEFHMHQARIDGEKAKVQVYGAQVEAYSKMVDGAKTEASIKIEEAKARVESNRNLIAAYSSDIEGYKARLQGLIEKMNSSLKLYEAQGSVYRAKVDAEVGIASVDVKAHEAAIQALIANMNLGLKEAEVNIQAYAEVAKLRVAAAEGGARVASQLAAGIFSGVSVQAHLSAGASASKNYSGQESLGESHTYKEK